MKPQQWAQQWKGRGANTTKKSKGGHMQQPKHRRVWQPMSLSAPGEQGALSALILEDPGSTHNLITRELAQVLMLPGH